MGVIAATVVLLSTVVHEGDTKASQREDCGSAETLLVAIVVAQEASVVVVINEKTEKAQVREVALLSSVSVLDVTHVLTRAENIRNGVVHRVVEQTGNNTLVGTNIGGVSVEALTHLEDTGSRAEFGPERHGNFRNGVNSDTIETVGVDEVVNPVL